MKLGATEIQRWATELREARLGRAGHAPLSSLVDLDIEDAYAIQRAGTALRVTCGERIVGWKLGYTSIAMREQMGIAEPNFGPLTDAMLLGTGDAVSQTLLQPRVEPEIAVRFGRPLQGRVTIEQVLDAVDDAFASLEVVDSVYPDYRFQLVDNTADGSSAAQVVIGPRLDRLDALESVSVTLRHNGSDVGSATGAAASGHPAAGVVWLVDQLDAIGRGLDAGDIVITGGLTKAAALAPGDTISAIFDETTEVSVHRLASQR